MADLGVAESSDRVQPYRPCRPGVTVVVMAYDEVTTLASVIEEIRAALAEIRPVPAEILIINDGSTDGTGALADRLASEDEYVRVLHHPTNLGLGEVYRSGILEAERELVTFWPADGQFPASIIPEFFRLAERCDIVLGYLPRRHDRAGAFLSWTQRLVYRVLVGRLPRFQGVMMLRREVLGTVHVSGSGRAATLVFELILKAVAAGCRVVSVPTPYRPRKLGYSKVNNWRTIKANVIAALQLRRRMAGGLHTGNRPPAPASGVGQPSSGRNEG